jgi:hypothetical protein
VVAVHVLQGKYAHPATAPGGPPPDIVLESIAGLAKLPATAFHPAAA